jgi:hypothetical protein
METPCADGVDRLGISDVLRQTAQVAHVTACRQTEPVHTPKTGQGLVMARDLPLMQLSTATHYYQSLYIEEKI